MAHRAFYNDIPPYYHYFFDLVNTDDLITALLESKRITEEIFASITPDKENFSYAPGKWTAKQVIRHIIDCEKIYTYRALRFSRFDATELPGFDENSYMEHIKCMEYSLEDLREEYVSVRNSTLFLYKNMTDEMLHFKGIANKVNFTAKALGFMTVGHNLHHCNFIKTTYLNQDTASGITDKRFT